MADFGDPSCSDCCNYGADNHDFTRTSYCSNADLNCWIMIEIMLFPLNRLLVVATFRSISYMHCVSSAVPTTSSLLTLTLNSLTRSAQRCTGSTI